MKKIFFVLKYYAGVKGRIYKFKHVHPEIKTKITPQESYSSRSRCWFPGENSVHEVKSHWWNEKEQMDQSRNTHTQSPVTK